jgi:hypothetical protein
MADTIPRIQRHMATWVMREMPLLRTASALIGPEKPARILSFGCSVGDELASLHCAFPAARLFGCDVEPAALAAAARILPGDAEVFPSTREAIAAHGPYDMVCALSSLCLHPPPKPEVMQARLPFALFEDLLGFLVDQLVPGGVLVVVNPSYCVSDTAVAARLQPVRRTDLPFSAYVPVWNPDGTLALGYRTTQIANVPHAAETRGRTEWAFYDSIFLNRPGAPILLHDPQPAPSGIALRRWVRSNLDGMTDAPPPGAIEVIQHYTLWAAAPGNAAATWVTAETERQRIGGGAPFRWPPLEVARFDPDLPGRLVAPGDGATARTGGNDGA